MRRVDTMGLTRDRVEMTGEDHQYRMVLVPAGCAAAIYNDGPEEALVLNLPSPAWSAAEPDEWPVENWVDFTLAGAMPAFVGSAL